MSGYSSRGCPRRSADTARPIGSQAVLLPLPGIHPAAQVDGQRVREAAAGLAEEGEIFGQLLRRVKFRHLFMPYLIGHDGRYLPCRIWTELIY